MREPTGREPYTPVIVKDTSATERAAFRRCRRQWFLGVVQHLENVEGNQNYWLGTLVHKGLEAYYSVLRDRKWRSDLDYSIRAATHQAAIEYAFDEYMVWYHASLITLEDTLGFLWSSVEPTYFELGQLGFDMLVAYFNREQDEPLFDEIIDVEQRIAVPIRTPGGRKVGVLSVTTDLVGRRNGILSTADHKTASREMSESQLDLDDQLTAEVYAVWLSRGEFPEEAVYNVLMKKVAVPPKRLQDGKGGVVRLSKDKSQPTTYLLYKAELEKHHLPVQDYEDVLEHFWNQEQSGESPFFRRSRVLRSEAQMASFETNLYHEWRDIKRVAAHPEQAYPNPNVMNCMGCSVKIICMAMQDDGDVESVMKAGFIVGDPRR
jgi:hypothetical protein